jgi:two-component system response regulator HupR/HoxA
VDADVGDLDLKRYPVLAVDDEPNILETFRFNYDEDFTILTAGGGREALDVLEREPVAVLVTDQRMPEMPGLELIRRALDLRPNVVPIMLTGFTDVEALVGAINLGRIHRYIPKPWDRRELRSAITRAIEIHHLSCENERLAGDNARMMEELHRSNERLAEENRYLRERDASPARCPDVIGSSPAITRVLDMVRRVAGMPTAVLLEGETGTGKELIARRIHAESLRSGPFVAVNSAAIPEMLLPSELFGHRGGAFPRTPSGRKGLFEIASGGTLFIEEIGETTPEVQVNLLRTLQEREIPPVGDTQPVPVDVRVVAATNRDLEEEIRCGRFREDLFSHLKVLRIVIPPLRERLEDVPALADHFLGLHAGLLHKPIRGFAPDAVQALVSHRYRGNVRELANTIERAVLLCEPDAVIRAGDLFERPPDGTVRPQEA